MKTAVFSFGRMNPPTIGHEKLVEKVIAVAKKERGTPFIFLSHTQDKKKNPLTYDQKIDLAQRAFGPIVKSSPAKVIIEVLKSLQTYDRVVMVVGSDRVVEFDTLLQKYNGKEYNFKEIVVMSAGERDPDADDVSGMSASKMRALAVEGNIVSFKKGLPSRLQSDADEIMKMIRKQMGLSEGKSLMVMSKVRNILFGNR